MMPLVRRVSLLAAFSLVVAAVACSDPVTPPPARAEAVVALKANDILVFAGQSVALRDLVWRVTDPSGVVLTDYRLEAVLPAGWTFRNDTIIAPAGETKARLRVRATYQPTGVSHFAGPSFADTPTDTTDTATVTSAVDLKAHRWQVQYRCSAAGYDVLMTDENVFVDSVEYAGVVDSVVYATDGAWIPQFGGVAQLWASGQARRWLRDGTADIVSYADHHEILRQAPDTLVAGWATYGNDEHPLVRVPTSDGLLRYEGGTFCMADFRHYRGPVTMQEVAP